MALALLLALAACKGDGEPAPAAAPPVAAPAADRRPSVVFLGDSLTAGLGLSADEAVPARIASRIEEAGLPFKVVNGGRSGDTSAGGLARFDWVVGSANPDVAIVQLGANDGLRGLDPKAMEG
ncbi:MAG TPA: GDSL-type esterase/lipase family protein, partial [Kofleriaceae bacterium]|nr:GDSL-type esterase/lipase family protein [Kofleriaceae bacterium]